MLLTDTGEKFMNCQHLGNLFEFLLLVNTFYAWQHVKIEFTSPNMVVDKTSLYTIPMVD